VSHLSTEVRSSIDRWWYATSERKSGWSAHYVGGQGRSVAKVWRVCDNQDVQNDIAWALKAWGWKTSQQSQLEEILNFQSFLHQRFECAWNELVSVNPIPEVVLFRPGTPILECDSTLWTLARWCPGQSKANGGTISDAFLEQSSCLLAKLHLVGHTHGNRVSRSVGLMKRLQCVLHWSEESVSTQMKRWLDGAFHQSSASDRDMIWKPLAAAFHQTVVSFNLMRKHLVSRLEADAKCLRTNHWIIGDLWRENILVDATKNECITGLIDFGAARIDWAPLEVVRWFSSFLPFDDPRLAHLLHRYNEIRNPSVGEDSASEPHELTLQEFRWLDGICTLTSLLQWFSWLADNDFEFAFLQTRVLPRIQELSARLECMHCSSFPIS
jgi:Phosphotransferase enzyme family